jgi:hypothetical protein
MAKAGEHWNTLSEEDKKPYNEKHEADQKRY